MSRTDFIVGKAKKLVLEHETRNPDRLAESLGIIILPTSFKKQKGLYKIIERNRFIIIKDDLESPLREIVLLHEIGHDALHRREAKEFHEFNIFDMQNNTMEYEANLFAAEISLPDEEILEYIYQGYNAAQISSAMYSDINLVALKVAELNRRGYGFRSLEHRNDFLK